MLFIGGKVSFFYGMRLIHLRAHFAYIQCTLNGTECIECIECMLYADFHWQRILIHVFPETYICAHFTLPHAFHV